MNLVALYEKALDEDRATRDDFYTRYINDRETLITDIEEKFLNNIQDLSVRHKEAEEYVESLATDIENKRDIYSLRIAELEKVIEKMKQAN